MKENALRSFVVQLIILLPSLYFAWYASAPLLSYVLAFLLKPLLVSLWPDVVLNVASAESKILIFVKMLPLEESRHLAPPVSGGEKGVIVNPLSYSYGLPLFLALALASMASFRQHLARMVVGAAVIAAGICFTVAVSLVFALDANPKLQGIRLATDPETNDLLIRYLHFLGFNVVPRMLPLLAWGVLYRETGRAIVQPLLGGTVSESRK